MKLIICEKPSQAKQIKEVVGSEYIVTNARGHLLELQIGNNGKWELEKLPITPKASDLNGNQINNYSISDDKKELFMQIKKELDKKPTEIICATDPDFEGEAIYRTIIEYYEKKFGEVTANQKRLILKDVTYEGIKNQMQKLEPIENYDGWRERAYGRAYADFLMGVNCTQALTLVSGNGQMLTAGRVQTPTLRLIVERYLNHKNHKKNYTYGFSVIVDGNKALELTNSKHIFEQTKVRDSYVEKLNKNGLIIVESKNTVEKPPKLHNLASLQTYMNKKHKMKASDTLTALQGLYDAGYCSYPRTDCQVLTEQTANQLLNSIKDNLLTINTYLKKELVINESFNTQLVGKVSAHEGLTITNEIPNELSLNQSQVYDEILRTNVSNFLNEIQISKVTVSTDINEYKYSKIFNYNLSEGNTFLDVYHSKTKFEVENINYSKLNNQMLDFKYDLKEYESKAKPFYTEGTLLSAMKNLGKDTDEKDIFKEIEGIGTPATRSEIIEGLFKNRYITNDKDKLIPTQKGLDIISVLNKQDNPLVNLTNIAELEHQLRKLEDGSLLFADFIKSIDETNENIIDTIIENNIILKKEDTSLGKCPKCSEGRINGIKGKYGKFYACNNKECDFKVPNYVSFTDKDISNMLAGKKSGVKKCKSKAGNEYKAKFSLINGKLEQEFYNSKKK